MNSELIGLIGILVLIILLLARMWIAAAMALVGFVGYAYLMGLNASYSMIAQIPFTTMYWYPMTTVPLYTFMGIVLFQSEVGKDLYETAYTWVGQLKGGLAMATVFACALFAAITGVSSPAIVTMAKVALPARRKYGYDEQLALGSICCAGGLAFIIPPSMSLIIYGVLTETSIAKLYMAGFLPGLLLVFLFISLIRFITWRNPKAGPAGANTSFKEKIISLKLTWPTVLLFVLVLGGIYLGIFTPTEGGAVGAFGAVVITASMRRLNFKKLVSCLLEATQTTAFIMLMIIGAYLLMKFLAVSKLPQLMSSTVAALPVPPVVILAGVIVIYIILGMFLDIFSAVILTLPVFFPLVKAMGWDPIWFGVIITILIEMGLVTPPVGMDVFVLSGVSKIPVGTIFKGVMPFVLVEILAIIIIIIFPQIALFLPSTMSG